MDAIGLSIGVEAIGRTSKGRGYMDGFACRSIGVATTPARLRAWITRRDICPGCRAVGSVHRVTHVEDWGLLGQTSVSRRTCGVCAAAVVEGPAGYLQIGGTAPRRSLARRLLSR